MYKSLLYPQISDRAFCMESLQIIQSELDAHIRATIAQEEDYTAIKQLLFDTAKWLQSKNLDQWGALLEGKDVHNTHQAIKENHVVIFRSLNELLGTVTLFNMPTEWDKGLWGDTEKAIYVHRIAINRKFSGKGYGQKIMQWIEYGLHHNFPYKIRLDCVAQSHSLNAFYSGLGYAYKGNKNGYNLYQKFIKLSN